MNQCETAHATSNTAHSRLARLCYAYEQERALVYERDECACVHMCMFVKVTVCNSYSLHNLD
jgi:hypothetical protein